MKKQLLVLVALLCLQCELRAQTKSEIKAYVTFLSGQNQSARDYILELFKTHDIVIICERSHPELTQYELFTNIISDKRFVQNVGNIFVEIGTSKLNPAFYNFLHTTGLSKRSVDDSITHFQRDASMWPLWDELNYHFFYENIYHLNNSLPADKQINVYPSDIPFYWPETDTVNIKNLRGMLAGRDSIIASQIITSYDAIVCSGQKRKKALVIMNYRHAFNQQFPMPGGQTLRNVAWYLFNHYDNKVANVFLNTVNYSDNNNIGLVQDGKWDAAFKKTGKQSAGFSIKGTPFGADSLDVWPLKNPYTYGDVFTGFIFYLPVEKHLLAEGVPGLVDSVFKIELYRRIALVSTVGGEFKSKMQDFSKALAIDPPYFNTTESRPYFNLDSLLVKTNRWLK